MRKGNAFRQLSRMPKHKWAMLRNMVTSLIKHERIETTMPKAKELRRVADKVIGWAKDGAFSYEQIKMKMSQRPFGRSYNLPIAPFLILLVSIGMSFGCFG
jgi:ribosomal protein L17